MIRPQISAWLRKETLFGRTGPLCQLLFTGREPEVCRGAPHIMDIPLKVRLLCQRFRLPEQGLMASGLYDPSLVEGQGAETAGSKAAPVADQAELDLTNCRDAL